MAKLVKKRGKKMGQPPGTLIYLGEKEGKHPEFSLIEYNEADLRESAPAAFDRCLTLRPDYVSWLNVNGLANIQDLEKIGECFKLHHLILEDILNTDQRPKLEDLGDYLYLVLKMLHYNDQGELSDDQVSLVFGKNYLLSLHDNDRDLFTAIRERLRARGRLRRLGADYLAYSLVDLIVDHYFLVLERLGESVEDLEEELVTQPTQDTLRRIHQLKREMIILRRSVWPLREVLSQLQRRESPLIEEATAIYFKDVYDHIIQVIDSIETYRDMLSGMLDVYLSSVSNRLNEIMKVLTVIATIFIPLTFVTGLYGMNLEGFFPAKEAKWGFGAVWGLSIGIALYMLWYFKRRGWLRK